MKLSTEISAKEEIVDNELAQLSERYPFEKRNGKVLRLRAVQTLQAMVNEINQLYHVDLPV